MWHCPQVAGSRASAIDASCREWHCVQDPIDPSLFGLPMLWQAMQPVSFADPPSSIASLLAGRSTAPLCSSDSREPMTEELICE